MQVHCTIMAVVAQRQYLVICFVCLLSFGFCQTAEEAQVSLDISPPGPEFDEGTNVYISCSVTGFNLNTNMLSWSKDGQRITRDDMILDEDLKERMDMEFYFHFDSTDISDTAFSYLSFTSITKLDTGIYACEVYQVETGARDTLVTFDTVGVSVLYVPSSEYPQCKPSQIFIEIGQTSILSCFSEEGNPKVNITWERLSDVDEDLQHHSVYRAGFVTSELVLSSVSLAEQNAVFSCKITGISPPRRCNVTTHVVLPEPLVTISPQVATASIGSSAQFACYSYLTMDNLFWLTDPRNIGENSNAHISSNRQVLTLTDLTARENGSLISCTFQYKDDWIRATAVLYVTEMTTTTTMMTTTTTPTTINETGRTTPHSDDNNLNSTASFSVGSAIAWMIAFILVTLIAIVGFITCYLKLKSKTKDNNKNKTPYVISNIGGNVNSEGEGYEVMETGGYMAYRAPTAPPDNQQPAQTNSSDAQGPNRVRNPTLDNPEYMRHGDYVGAPNRPIQIRNMSRTSDATTVEPDYMRVEA